MGATMIGMSLAFASENYIFSALLAIALAAEIVLTTLLAAYIGAAILGVAASPVFTCGLIGTIATTCGAMLSYALIAGAATLLCDSPSPRYSY